MSTEQWFWGLVSVVVLAAIGWVAIEAVNAPTLEDPTPLDDLLGGQDPAEKAAAKFTRAGWTEVAPGYWVKTPPELADDECPLESIPGCDVWFMASVLADIEDLTCP